MLIGKRIVLRPVQKEDIASFQKWRNNLRTKALTIMHPFPVTLESEEAWFHNISTSKEDKSVFFTIVENENVIGYVKLFNINWINRNCYFGIVIGEESARGKGIGEEATKLIINYAFKVLNLRKIILEVVDFNSSAINLYKKLGFVEEGLLKETVFIEGEWHNVLIMSLFNKSNKDE